MACDWLQTNEKKKSFASKLFSKQRKSVQNKRNTRPTLFRSELKKTWWCFAIFSSFFFLLQRKVKVVCCQWKTKQCCYFFAWLNWLVNFYRQWLGELIEITVRSVCVCVCVCVCAFLSYLLEILLLRSFSLRYIRSILWELFHSHIQSHVIQCCVCCFV